MTSHSRDNNHHHGVSGLPLTMSNSNDDDTNTVGGRWSVASESVVTRTYNDGGSLEGGGGSSRRSTSKGRSSRGGSSAGGRSGSGRRPKKKKGTPLRSGHGSGIDITYEYDTVSEEDSADYDDSDDDEEGGGGGLRDIDDDDTEETNEDLQKFRRYMTTLGRRPSFEEEEERTLQEEESRDEPLREWGANGYTDDNDHRPTSRGARSGNSPRGGGDGRGSVGGDDTLFDGKTFASTVIPRMERRKFFRKVVYPSLTLLFVVGIGLAAAFVAMKFIREKKLSTGGGYDVAGMGPNGEGGGGAPGDPSNTRGIDGMGIVQPFDGDVFRRSFGPKEEQALQALQSLLATVSSLAAMEQPGTPQYRAAHWAATDPLVSTYLEKISKQNMKLITNNNNNGNLGGAGVNLNRNDPILRSLRDRYAIATVFFATGGPPPSAESQGVHNQRTGWITAGRWLSVNHVCDWQGVSCHIKNDNTGTTPTDPDTHRIVRTLRLVSNNLVGQIPEEIGIVNTIDSLDFSDNKISGHMPTNMALLQELKELSLSNNRISGALDVSKLGNPDKLEMLLLDTNLFDGEVPPSIGALRSLFVLNLSNNNFWGQLPREIVHMSNLFELDLSNNEFEGILPAQMNQMTDLTKLRLSRNAFAGRLVDFTMFANMFGLVELKLDDNAFEGPIPPWLGQLVNLQVLTLDRNRFSSQGLPEQLKSISRLEKLTLEENNIVGAIPKFLCDMPALKMLSADCGGGGGGTPPPKVSCECCDLCFPKDGNGGGGGNGQQVAMGPMSINLVDEQQQAQKIGASGVKPPPDTEGAGGGGGDAASTAEGETEDAAEAAAVVTTTTTELEDLPPELMPLISDLSDPEEVFQDPESPQSKALEWLKNDGIYQVYAGVVEPEHGEGEDILLEQVLERYALSALYFASGGSKWKDATKWLSAVPSCDWLGVICNEGDGRVKELQLMGNKMIGVIPNECSALKELEKIDLSDNQINGPFPHMAFSGLDKLRFLSMSGNAMAGELQLPSGLNVEILLLDGNEFEGPIPESLGDYTSLMALGLSKNKFNGAIPSVLSNLDRLYDLDLSENELQDEIPPEFGNLVQMEELKLGNNSLGGELPDTFENLQELKHLELSNNEIGGGIPAWITSLVSLKSLYLQGNLFSGNLPEEMGQLHQLEILAIEDNGLVGDVPQSLCDLSPRISASCDGDDAQLSCSCCICVPPKGAQ